jgi:hypothetical protein
MRGGNIIASARPPPGNPDQDPDPAPKGNGPTTVSKHQPKISVFSLFTKGISSTESPCSQPHLPKMNQSKFKLKTPRNTARYRKYWIDATTGKKFFDSDPFSATPENSQPPSPEKQQDTSPQQTEGNKASNKGTTPQNNPRNNYILAFLLF